MKDETRRHRNTFRAFLLSVGLLFATAAAAQGCISEQEPNDSPAEANPVQEAACLACS